MKIKSKINDSKNIIIQFLDRIILPGFDGIPLYKLIVFLLSNLKHGALTVRASSIAYNTFLAIFPALIFFLSLIAYVPIENFHQELLKLAYYLMSLKASSQPQQNDNQFTVHLIILT